MIEKDMETDYKKLAMRIKEVRHRKGITQEKLAFETGLMDYLLSDTIKLSDKAILNISALNDTERRFIANTIKGIKEIQAELIEQLK